MRTCSWQRSNINILVRCHVVFIVFSYVPLVPVNRPGFRGIPGQHDPWWVDSICLYILHFPRISANKCFGTKWPERTCRASSRVLVSSTVAVVCRIVGSSVGCRPWRHRTYDLWAISPDSSDNAWIVIVKCNSYFFRQNLCLNNCDLRCFGCSEGCERGSIWVQVLWYTRTSVEGPGKKSNHIHPSSGVRSK